MDELLHARVKQLREIEERLERMTPIGMTGDLEATVAFYARVIRDLRRDVQDMVRVAEHEHENF